MALRLFGFHDHPHDFAVTKADVPLENCVFLLDFSRPLEKVRWFGKLNRWLGITVGLLVPVVHQSEQSGEYLIGVFRGEPYFFEIQELWKRHRGSARTFAAPPVGGLEIVADFATHFPEDCKQN